MILLQALSISTFYNLATVETPRLHQFVWLAIIWEGLFFGSAASSCGLLWEREPSHHLQHSLCCSFKARDRVF